MVAKPGALEYRNAAGQQRRTFFLDPNSLRNRACFTLQLWGHGNLQSTDAGKTWALRNSGISGSEPFAYRLTLDTAGILYLVVARRSTDGSFGNDGDGALFRSWRWR